MNGPCSCFERRPFILRQAQDERIFNACCFFFMHCKTLARLICRDLLKKNNEWPFALSLSKGVSILGQRTHSFLAARVSP